MLQPRLRGELIVRQKTANFHCPSAPVLEVRRICKSMYSQPCVPHQSVSIGKGTFVIPKMLIHSNARELFICAHALCLFLQLQSECLHLKRPQLNRNADLVLARHFQLLTVVLQRIRLVDFLDR